MIAYDSGAAPGHPRVQVEIIPERLMRWFVEVSYTWPEDAAWVHDYRRDRTGFGFWRMTRKAIDIGEATFEHLLAAPDPLRARTP